MNTTTQHPTSVQESKIGQQLANKSPRQSGRERDRNHVDYWKSRLFHNAATRANGQHYESSRLAIRIYKDGVRETFSLKSSDKRVAAQEAKEIYAYIVANGMKAAIEKFKPTETVESVASPTVGQFLAEVKAKANIRERTLKNYMACFRKIVADIVGIDGGGEKGTAKYDYRNGGRAEWLAKVDGVMLSDITPAKVQKWKIAFLSEAGDDLKAKERACRNVNSYIRNSRALFSRKATKFIEFPLPSALPFTGIELEKEGSCKYRSTIDCQALITAARNELATDHPEQFKTFLLALGAGLRKAEIDNLTWEQMDWANNQIHITTTEYFRPKTEGSEASVDVDPDVMGELRKYAPVAKGAFVIRSHREAKPNVSWVRYRCDNHFDGLIEWLRGKGINGDKPLHTLRKEFGSLVCAEAGIYAASTALRHANIHVTAEYYVSKKNRVTAPIGKFLGQIEPQVLPDLPKAVGE